MNGSFSSYHFIQNILKYLNNPHKIHTSTHNQQHNYFAGIQHKYSQ
jgi:hypothetical protein